MRNTSRFLLLSVALVTAFCAGYAPWLAASASTSASVVQASSATVRVIFADEFNDDRLDLTKWLPCVSHGQLPWPAKCTGWGVELQSYRTGSVQEKDGQLLLTAAKWDGQYTSGAISTAQDVFGYNQTGYHDFTYKYGYIEARMKLPEGQGLWPAFWALPYNSKGNEIDFVETIGSEPSTSYHSLHADNGQSYTGVNRGTDLTKDWHIFGTRWTANDITWYVDGRVVYEVSRDVPQQPMFIQFNLAIGGDWPGSPDKTTRFPSSLAIDYVRVYEYMDSGS